MCANTPDKRRSVDQVVASIKKRYGLSDTSLVINKGSALAPRERIPTGIYSLDRALRGGFPRGQWSCIYGGVGSCKTTISYMTIAEAQRLGLSVVYIDAEARFNSEWASIQGADTNKLDVVNVMENASAEQVLDLYITVASERAADLIVIDSISGLSPREELDKTMEENSMALTARVLSKFFRKSTGVNSSANICGLLIGQIRATMSQYAPKLDSLAGGNALRHYCEYIVRTSRKNATDANKVTRDTGFIATMNMMKAPGVIPEQLEFEFRHNVGIDVDADVITRAVKCGVIERSGASYIMPGTGEKVRGIRNLMNSMVPYGHLSELRARLDDIDIFATGSIQDDDTNNDADNDADNDTDNDTDDRDTDTIVQHV